MQRAFVILALACSAVAGCGGTNGPTAATPGVARLSRTRFMAFGDSFTAGEVTNPIAQVPGSVHGLIVLPAASYPVLLQGQLQAAYPSQASSMSVVNAGESGERILDGVQRFPSAFDANRPEVVLLMEGANGLPGVGPDISASLMRIMVLGARNGRARVFVGSMIPQVAGRPRATTAEFELLNYNRTLQQMSIEEGATFVDLYNAMRPEAGTLIGSDGVHPTEVGYRRIAELFFAAIKSALEER
ncbi:MAG: SGNH/GDSL hydrolase family protein [Vicinamibacterales bacterium]